MKFQVFRTLALIVICLVCSPSHKATAQHVGGNPGPCPRGSAPVNGTCGSPSNAYPTQQVPPQEIWRSRYGAIAFSLNGDVTGLAEGQLTKRAARKLAMRKCVGPACKIVAEYSNSCGALAWGPEKDGVMGFGVDIDPVTVEIEAVENCKTGGGGECEAIKITCSLPVRIQ